MGGGAGRPSAVWGPGDVQRKGRRILHVKGIETPVRTEPLPPTVCLTLTRRLTESRAMRNQDGNKNFLKSWDTFIHRVGNATPEPETAGGRDQESAGPRGGADGQHAHGG